MIFTDRTFQTLLSREILRFTRVWMQTIVPQLLTSLLYLVVFGIALGGRIKQIEGIPYLAYILGGMLRGVVMGAGVFVVGVPFVGLNIQHPLMLIVIGLLASFAFSSFGTMVGALATRIEHISLITSVIIQQ